MAMRRETGIQDDLVATWAEMPRSPGHAFYDRLQALLKEAGFDAFVEDLCKPENGGDKLVHGSGWISQPRAE